MIISCKENQGIVRNDIFLKSSVLNPDVAGEGRGSLKSNEYTRINFLDVLFSHCMTFILPNLEPLDIISLSLTCRSAMTLVRQYCKELIWSRRKSNFFHFSRFKDHLNDREKMNQNMHYFDERLLPGDMFDELFVVDASVRSIKSNWDSILEMAGHCDQPSSSEFSLAFSIAQFVQRVKISNAKNLTSFNFLSLTRLENLQSLSLGGVSTTQVNSLLLTLWELPRLTYLSISFNRNLQDKNNYYWSCLSTLTELVVLKLKNVPKSFNSNQKFVLETCKRLKVLNIVYMSCQKIKTDYLNKFADLQELKLSFPLGNLVPIELSAFHEKLKVLKILNGYVLPSQIQCLTSLTNLEMTPWGWRKMDLKVFSSLTNLKKLSIRVNWLPDATEMQALFPRLTTLKLIELDIGCCAKLVDMKGLTSLSIIAPFFQRRLIVKFEDLRPLMNALPKAKNLRSFSLIQAPHSIVEMSKILETGLPNLAHLRLEVCKYCLGRIVTKNEAFRRLKSLSLYSDFFDWKLARAMPCARFLFTSKNMQNVYKCFDAGEVPWQSVYRSNNVLTTHFNNVSKKK